MKHIRWIREHLFNGPINSALSLVILYFGVRLSWWLVHWGVYDSVVIGDSATCRAAEGACWAFIVEKFHFIIFGFFPNTEYYRPTIALVAFVVLLFHGRTLKHWTRFYGIAWFLFFIASYFLMAGGAFGLSVVSYEKWGGLPLTLMLATIGGIFAYPVGVLLALGRRSQLPVVKTFSICYIELIRGVPLISILFMSSVIFPLFLPEGVEFSKLLRAQVAIIMFFSAYLAEVVRGGLAAIPSGQYEAADSLGLNYFQTMRFIILPQALRLVIPPTVNTFIGMFKDTSLVIIIALFDLMYTVKASLADANWLGFAVEGFTFIALVYFIFCYALALISRRFERELNTSR